MLSIWNLKPSFKYPEYHLRICKNLQEDNSTLLSIDPHLCGQSKSNLLIVFRAAAPRQTSPSSPLSRSRLSPLPLQPQGATSIAHGCTWLAALQAWSDQNIHVPWWAKRLFYVAARPVHNVSVSRFCAFKTNTTSWSGSSFGILVS